MTFWAYKYSKTHINKTHSSKMKCSQHCQLSGNKKLGVDYNILTIIGAKSFKRNLRKVNSCIRDTYSEKLTPRRPVIWILRPVILHTGIW